MQSVGSIRGQSNRVSQYSAHYLQSLFHWSGVTVGNIRQHVARYRGTTSDMCDTNHCVIYVTWKAWSSSLMKLKFKLWQFKPFCETREMSCNEYAFRTTCPFRGPTADWWQVIWSFGVSIIFLNVVYAFDKINNNSRIARNLGDNDAHVTFR